MPFKDKNRYKTQEYKALQAEWSRNWYKRNKVRVIANNIARKKRHANGTISLGKGYSAQIAVKHTLPPCISITVIPEKEFSVATAVRNGKNIKAIEKEIKKCIVLCANCHAIRHYDYHRGILLDLGVAGQFEQIEAALHITEEEEPIHLKYFNNGTE